MPAKEPALVHPARGSEHQERSEVRQQHHHDADLCASSGHLTVLLLQERVHLHH